MAELIILPLQCQCYHCYFYSNGLAMPLRISPSSKRFYFPMCSDSFVTERSQHTDVKYICQWPVVLWKATREIYLYLLSSLLTEYPVLSVYNFKNLACQKCERWTSKNEVTKKSSFLWTCQCLKISERSRRKLHCTNSNEDPMWPLSIYKNYDEQ